jgi:ABC-type lipoprotein release transport system permease subunit
LFFTYLRRELRRRARQASIIALGLGVGIGLVITVAALSSGVKSAQAEVLHSLYGVGTDVTVTKPPTSSDGPAPFGFHGSTGTAQQPAKGTKIDVDTLDNPGLGTLDASSIDSIAGLRDVAAAAGGLVLTDTKVTGKIPAINPSSGNSTSGPSISEGTPSDGGNSTFRGSLTPTSFSVDGVQLSEGELGPLSSGELVSGRTLSPRDATSNVALLDSNYAKQKKLTTGSKITIAKKTFTVVGIVSTPAGASGSDVYIPLARAQALSGMKDKVNTIYVTAASSTRIGAVSKEISALLPKATVTTSSSLADNVTGSVSSASDLANKLGRWLAIAVLIAAFLLATLLTMSAVSRRVSEFGTLKALGWRSRRVVRQVLGESVAIGVLGGVVGVGLGFLGAALITHFSPTLSASVGQATGSATPGGVQVFGAAPGGTGGPPASASFQPSGAGADQSISVHLSAPVTVGVILAAVLLAIAGGLVSGTFGSWRAARLRPAAALARIG